jgi:hypothetical protein
MIEHLNPAALPANPAFSQGVVADLRVAGLARPDALGEIDAIAVL